MRNDWDNASCACCVAIGFTGIAFTGTALVTDGGAGLDIGTDVEQHGEVWAVRDLAACEGKADYGSRFV
jgi:hypothetical protein